MFNDNKESWESLIFCKYLATTQISVVEVFTMLNSSDSGIKSQSRRQLGSIDQTPVEANGWAVISP